MPYVIERVRKSGARYTVMYTDENGRYKSAGTYDSEARTADRGAASAPRPAPARRDQPGRQGYDHGPGLRREIPL